MKVYGYQVTHQDGSRGTILATDNWPAREAVTFGGILWAAVLLAGTVGWIAVAPTPLAVLRHVLTGLSAGLTLVGIHALWDHVDRQLSLRRARRELGGGVGR